MTERVLRGFMPSGTPPTLVQTVLLRLCICVVLLFSCGVEFVHSAEIKVRLLNPPSSGSMVFLLFDSPNTFGDLRNPLKELTFLADGRETYIFKDIPAGEYAFVIYSDENGNGRLDKNFVGIPNEPILFSNRYRPKGPPSYSRACFELNEEEIRTFEAELVRPLGKLGRFGAGIGMIARSSPYRGSDKVMLQPIPVLTYYGKRLQFWGTGMQLGLFGADGLRLAATANYRFAPYEEDDSSALEGLGNRKETLMAGLSLIFELPVGVNLRAGYEHDVLDRIGGGSARVGVAKSYQYGVARLTPEVGINWLSSELSDHDYGVETDKSTPARPAYRLDDTFSIEVGTGVLLELSSNWRVICNVAVEFLEDEVYDSPIVSEAHVLKSFVAVNYVF